MLGKQITAFVLSSMLVLGMVPCALAEEARGALAGGQGIDATVVSNEGNVAADGSDEVPSDDLGGGVDEAPAFGAGIDDPVENTDSDTGLGNDNDGEDDAAPAAGVATLAAADEPLSAGDAGSAVAPSIACEAHVQNAGWCAPTAFGVYTGAEEQATAGTVGQGLRMEALRLTLDAGTAGIAGGLEVEAHVQDYGWMDAQSAEAGAAAEAGITGESRRVEALRISLTGDMAARYAVYYRAHVQDCGWLGWACDGAEAGTVGYAKRMEAVQIALVQRDAGTGAASAPVPVEAPFLRPLVSCSAHVQNIGWMTPALDGAAAGTEGQGLRMEGLRIQLQNQKYEGSVVYNAHVQDVGWQAETDAPGSWASDGEDCGTVGQAKRVEAVQVALTGDMAAHYDVCYRVHVQNIGWLDWAMNGDIAGTTGMSYRIEAVQVELIEKGSAAPGTTGHSYYEGPSSYDFGGLQAIGFVKDIGETSMAAAGESIGVPNGGNALQGLALTLMNTGQHAFDGGIEYRLHVSNIGWTGWLDATDIQDNANSFSDYELECVQIRLTGQIAQYCSVYYRANPKGRGWLGWASNGQNAGSMGLSLGLESLQVLIVSNASGAPGPTAGHELVTREVLLQNRAAQILASCGDLRSAFYHIAYSYSYRSRPLWPSYAGWQEDYAIDFLDTGSGNCYSFACAFMYIARAAGCDARVVCGSVPLGGGGTGPHAWVEINSGGQVYICDPELQHELSYYNFYWVTYDNAPVPYYR